MITLQSSNRRDTARLAKPVTLNGSFRRLAPPAQSPRDWLGDLRLLWQRVRSPRRLDLYVARMLGRPLSDRRYLELGATFVAVGIDITLLAQATRKLAADYGLGIDATLDAAGAAAY